MTQSKTDRFENGPYFEEALIQVLLSDHKFAEQMMEVLNVQYFTLHHLRDIAMRVQEYYAQYRAFPSIDLLRVIMRSADNSDAGAAQIERYFSTLNDRPQGDLNYVKEEALEFCRKQKLLMAIERSLEMTATKNFDQIVKEIQDAASLGAERDFGHVWEERFEERMSEAVRRPIETPWKPVNDITQGGLSAGELATLMALTGVGKSHALVDLGAHAAMLGKSVVHLTFELSEVRTGKRYDARISGIAYDELAFNYEYAEQCVNNIKGRIRIKKYPNRKATVQTVRAYISKLRTDGFHPDLLIIDYADIMQSSKKYENKRFEEEAIYEELVSLAEELQLPIWTAAQTNRAGMDVEVLTLKHIAECFNKSQTCDLFITMNRQKNGNNQTLGNFFVAKNRMGGDGMKYLAKFDTSRSKIRVLEPHSAEEQDAKMEFDLGLEEPEHAKEERMAEKVRIMRARNRLKQEEEVTA